MPSALAPPAPSVLDAPGDLRRRAHDALLACVARHGLAKTTLDDVAREAGCARATLYRYFGGKAQLVGETVAAEAERLVTALRAAAAETDDLEDAVVAVTTTAARWFHDHAAVQFLITFEPELVLPRVAFDGADRLLAAGSDALAPAFAPYLEPGYAARLAEWVTRTTLVYVCNPASPFDLRDKAAARALVHEYVLPGFLPLHPARG